MLSFLYLNRNLLIRISASGDIYLIILNNIEKKIIIYYYFEIFYHALLVMINYNYKLFIDY